MRRLSEIIKSPDEMPLNLERLEELLRTDLRKAAGYLRRHAAELIRELMGYRQYRILTNLPKECAELDSAKAELARQSRRIEDLQNENIRLRKENAEHKLDLRALNDGRPLPGRYRRREEEARPMTPGDRLRMRFDRR